MAKKKPAGTAVVKNYRVLTPINGGEGNRLDVDDTFKLNENDAAELVEAGAIVEVPGTSSDESSKSTDL